MRSIFQKIFLVLVTLAGITPTDRAIAQGPSSPTPSSPSALSQLHPFGVHDMVRMQRVGEPHPSPDGQWVVFTVRSWDPETNKTTTNLWLVSVDGSELRQLTSAKNQTEASPAWSPDSRTIAFATGRSGSRQIWTIAVDGGEATQLTSFPIDVDNVHWSPQGSHIAFSAEVYPTADMAETAQRDKAKADSPVKAMKYDRLPIRHWDTWKDGKRSHVFVLPVKQSESARGWQLAGEAVDLMKGVDADCPTKPFGGAEDFAWSPDGQEIAYTAQLGRDFAWSTDLNLYLVAVSGGPAKVITGENKASDTGPVYSPDGRTIAYRAMARPGFESDRYRIKLYDRASGQTRTLTEAWDRSPGSVQWSPDGKTLLVTAADSARQKIFRVDVATGQPREIVKDHYNSGVTFSKTAASPRIFFSQDSLTAPAEIWSAKPDGSDLKRLTHFNDERVKLARMSEPAEFHFTGALGEKVQAWILKPVDWQAGKKYPVAFIIHGGPQGSIDDHFHYRWNPQAFTGAGYAVIAVNFHGSTGFGQAFTDSITGDWGGKPFEDLMKGLDHALANYPWLDGDRVGALGASYGGWMINWVNGHTNRFKCLVNHDGGFDELANYFTTEELWFPEWEFKGTPWERPELYEKFSPGRHVAKWQTPTLVIHGASDFRVIDAEGIATFTALQRRGIPSELLYFPDESHWVLKPKNSIVWHDTILTWLDKWLKH
jgi:dipeptidyl aminopeptidase/acylaminoacyl peptidase